uniref:Uncharacterized protein n=1 Tax=Ascaris lumbricoides TaxID=6252 RepID=A0A0M3IRN9_ASCLU
MTSTLCGFWCGCLGGSTPYTNKSTSLQLGCPHAIVMVSQLPSQATAVVSTSKHLSRQDHSRLSANEKRFRNRSLCSLLCTPPPYPGYSAVMTSIKSSGALESSMHSTWNNCRQTTPPSSTTVCTTTTMTPSSRASSRPTFCLTPDYEQPSPIEEYKDNMNETIIIILLISTTRAAMAVETVGPIQERLRTLRKNLRAMDQQAQNQIQKTTSHYVPSKRGSVVFKDELHELQMPPNPEYDPENLVYVLL